MIGGNNGTLQNGATFGAGEVDQGFSLDGSDDSVTVAQTIETNNEITLDAWINPSTLSLGWPAQGSHRPFLAVARGQQAFLATSLHPARGFAETLQLKQSKGDSRFVSVSADGFRH